jgi:hypothetical protein
MSAWKQYMNKRQLREGLADGHNPVDKFRFNTRDEDHAEDYEKTQTELFKTVMSKYPNETQEFLNSLAQRGDEEIANLLRKMRKDKGPRLPREPRHPTDGDEVVPSTADTGHNSEYTSD